MPINELIAERSGGASLAGDNPDLGDDGRPDTTSAETSMRTVQMLPPYLHNQDIANRSALLLTATGMSIVWLLNKVV